MPEFAPVFRLSSINASNGFRIDGAAAGDYSGRAVASAGDINGDGFDDVIVSAHGSDINGNNSGAAYVIFGKAGGIPAHVELSSLHAADGFRIDGVGAGNETGIAVASAGDVNNDGLADIIIGAPTSSPHGFQSGSAYVVFGRASGFHSALELSSLNGNNGFHITGAAAGDLAGTSVNSAGDINGDGFADIIIGAPGADRGSSNVGKSYVVFGHASGFGANLSLSALDGTNGFDWYGTGKGNYSGFSVSSAGDFNGDGFADFLIGAPDASPGGGVRFGSSAAPTPAATAGVSYVVFGSPYEFYYDTPLLSIAGVNGFHINGAAAGDSSGLSVASAGDVNGDGFGDLIVGAFGADNGGNGSGSSYVILGKDTGYSASDIQLSALDGKNGFRIDGAKAGDASGFSVSSAGDVNGDGYDDLIVGAFGADPGGHQIAGAAYVVFGKHGGFASAIDLAHLNGNNGFRINGTKAGNYTGLAVSAAGDVNGDGFADVVVGALNADPNGKSSGSSYVVYGHRAMVAVNRPGTDLANRINGGSGNDTIHGFDGNDTLIGWQGKDTIAGGAGKDVLNGGGGNDKLDGGGGNDRLNGQAGNDKLSGGAGSDHLNGGAGSDKLMGQAGGDHLAGQAGKDKLIGAGGNDHLSGGGGADTLDGGNGTDTLRGGAGSDHFVFKALVDSPVGSARDHITDFAKGIDKIDVSAIDAKSGVAGNQAFHFIEGAFTHAKGELHAVNSGPNSVVSGDVNGDGHADFAILIEGVHNLHAGDFIL